MVYDPNTPWQNGEAGGTPLSASRFQRIENGLVTSSIVADNALAAAQPEVIQDMLAALFLKAGSYLTMTYNDTANTLTFDLSVGVLREFLQDEVNAFLLMGTNMAKVYDDANGSLTLSSAGTGGGGSVGNASESVAGIIELATNQEVLDGAGSNLAVTPVTLAARITKLLTDVKGTPNNLASLDANGKLVTTQLPEMAIVRPFPAATQNAMLALNAQIGDIAIRADVPENYILSAEPATSLSNWLKLNGGTSAVSSVAGRIGAITLTSADITNFAAAVAAVDIVESKTWAGAVTLIDRSSNNQPSRGALRTGRPAIWIGGTGDPTNAIAGDVVFDLASTAPPLATRVFNGDFEGLALANNTTITTTNTAYTDPNIGGGSNTLVYTTTNPVTGTASARFLQATSGAVNTLGVKGLTAITDWSIKLDFNLETGLPATSMVLLRGYNDNAYTSTLSSFSMIVSTAGLITIQTGVGAAAGTELTSTGTNLTPATAYRFQIEGVVATNKLSVKLDTGPGTTVLWSATATPASGHEIPQITSARMGIGNSSANLTVSAEMQIGSGPGFLAA